NPLAWLAFSQWERAMESACDEAAVRGRTARERTLYCETLLQFATRRSTVPGSLAFGQGVVQRRIRHLLRCRRVGAGALALCAAAVALSATACMVRPAMEPAAGPTAEPTAGPTAEPAVEPTAEPPAQTQEEAAPAVLTIEEMAGQFANPVPDYTYISSYMAAGHRGDDLCAARGADVLAAADGVVLTAEYHSSMGNYVIIDHGTLGDGHPWRSLYSHMDDLVVAVGDTVRTGQLVGHVGSTGASTGNHLHFELTRDDQLMPPSCFTAYREEDTHLFDGTLDDPVTP
ncbi:MAG: peptidoglycan DD-metalloendopeptidase family protein, partial [Gemmiger sp.]